MTDYKLVPMEPTEAMIDAARDQHEGEPYLPVSLYKAMLAAAPEPPAVQAHEPVATVTEEVFGSDGTSDFISARLPVGTKLYAAPQPAGAALPPEITSEMLGMIIDEVFGGGIEDASVIEDIYRVIARSVAPQPAEQQPSPGVSALVEALTELCDEIDKHEIHVAISKTSISWFKRKARAALAQEQS